MHGFQSSLRDECVSRLAVRGLKATATVGSSLRDEGRTPLAGSGNRWSRGSLPSKGRFATVRRPMRYTSKYEAAAPASRSDALTVAVGFIPRKAGVPRVAVAERRCDGSRGFQATAER